MKTINGNSLEEKNTKKSDNIAQITLKIKLVIALLIFTSLGSFVAYLWFSNKYKTTEKIAVNVKEFSNQEYPENTALLSVNHKKYTNRTLQLIKKDDTHFDFVLEPTNPKTAKIIVKNVDISLFLPKITPAIAADRGLTEIYLTEREFSRQQVSFSPDSDMVEIIGGDGFEKQNIYSIDIANNCLNAGYWEIILSTKENDQKSVYYQGWFTFPMGHYKNIFEKINQIAYWDNWSRLEHWQDPDGTKTKLNLLRKVVDQQQIPTEFPLDEKIIVSGEQTRKVRTLLADNLVTWGDFYQKSDRIKFATFRTPGWYDNDTPWSNQYWRIGEFKKAILRTVKPVDNQENLQEIEFVFNDIKTGETNRLVASGINLKQLPKLSVSEYQKGLYLPLGIQVPPFFQSYEDLKVQSASNNPYFSVMLDEKDRWIDHHELAIDGFVMHLDKDNPNLLHTYLLSYERHTLIAHYISDLSQANLTPTQEN